MALASALTALPLLLLPKRWRRLLATPEGPSCSPSACGFGKILTRPSSAMLRQSGSSLSVLQHEHNAGFGVFWRSCVLGVWLGCLGVVLGVLGLKGCV